MSDSDDRSATADPPEHCPICGRALLSDGLPPVPDGDTWICGDCDQARTFDALDL